MTGSGGRQVKVSMMDTGAPTGQPRANDTRPIILLPGMTADGRMFRLQRPAFPSLITPDWIEPRDREPLGAYAQAVNAFILLRVESHSRD